MPFGLVIMGCPSSSNGKASACNVGDLGWRTGLGWSPGSPLQYSDLENSMDYTVYGASLEAQRLKRLPAMWETWVGSLSWEDPLQKEMATHSSSLAWRIPWMEKLGGLQSTGRKKWDTTERLHYTVYEVTKSWTWRVTFTFTLLVWQEMRFGLITEVLNCQTKQRSFVLLMQLRIPRHPTHAARFWLRWITVTKYLTV